MTAKPRGARAECEVAEYVTPMVKELAGLLDRHQLNFAGYLLRMAIIELESVSRTPEEIGLIQAEAILILLGSGKLDATEIANLLDLDVEEVQKTSKLMNGRRKRFG